MKGEKRRRKERRRGRRRRWRSQDQAKRYGTLDFCMELTLDMNSIMDHMDFVWNSRKDYEFQT